jgi:hypothetical protein
MALTWKTVRPKNALHKIPFRSSCAPGSGMGTFGDVSAMVVGAPRMPPGELYRRGMAGMGATNWIDTLTGGKITAISGQLASVERALKISTAASVVAGLVAVVSLLRRK